MGNFHVWSDLLIRQWKQFAFGWTRWVWEDPNQDYAQSASVMPCIKMEGSLWGECYYDASALVCALQCIRFETCPGLRVISTGLSQIPSL